MRIALALLWALALSLCNWVYLARAKVLKAEGLSAKVKAVLSCRSLIKIYSAVSFCAMAFLVIWQECFMATPRTYVCNLKYITLIGLLVPLAYEDFFTRRISNKVVLVGFGFRAIFYALEAIFYTSTFLNIFKQSLMGLLIGVAFLILGCFIIRNGIGMGDVKMLMLMGVFEGLYSVMTSIFFSLLVSFFVAIIALIRKTKNRKDSLPFAPCVLIGTFLSMVLTTV